MAVRIRILSPGKPKLDFVEKGIEEYATRLSHYVRVDLKWLSVRIQTKKTVPARVIEQEAAAIQRALDPSALLVVLDLKGKLLSSEELAAFFQRQMLTHSAFDFVIGGEWGIAPTLKKQADSVLSLSRLTLTHDLTRLILLEQIYRAFTILRGEKYHK